MWGRGVIGGIMLAGVVGACAITDPVDNRYDNIGRSLAKARNETIFLNIVRSAHDYPLSFTTIGSVTPSMTNTSTLGLPSFLVGPNPQCKNLVAGSGLPGAAGSAACLAVPGSPARDVIFGNTNNATNALSVSSNFNISTQETAQFYDGFLKPVDLYIVDYFIRQGYSRELLFWLFMDSFQIKFGTTELGFQYNPPYDYGCPPGEPKKRCFREFVEIATVTGLSVETKTVDTGSSSSSGGGGDTSGGASKSKTGSSSGGKGSKVYSRFCFDPVLAQRAVNAMQQVNPDRWAALKQFLDPPNLYKRTPICQSPWTPDPSVGETDTLTFHVGPAEFTLQPRSAFSMFQFLGNIIKMQKGQQPDIAPPYVPREDERDPPSLSTVADDQGLFTATQNFDVPCFVHTWFDDGDYCVPETAANTKRIFSILAQLIAIQTQASDLSFTPSVRVIN
jgi:hypothetical protein